MIDPRKIEHFARQVHDALPKGLRELGGDLEKKIRQTIQAQLIKLDLISREEFDIQTQVLLRTREKLALLEQRISVLEQQLQNEQAVGDHTDNHDDALAEQDTPPHHP